VELTRSSFGCLENSDYHPWVKAIFELARMGIVFQVLAQYPLLMRLVFALIPKRLMEERDHHMDLTKAKLRRRMEAGEERFDLVEGLLQKKDEWVGSSELITSRDRK
jgi:cytochrome P450